MQYTPNQVKDAVAGYGGADKVQVQKMVQARLELTSRRKPADAADAAALALCHLAHGATRAGVSPARSRLVADDRLAARQVLERDLAGRVLIEVAGVGYRRHVSPRARWPSSSRRRRGFLYVHHHIREDAQTALRLPHRATSGRPSRR